MFAIVEIGGKQYKVSPQSQITVDKLDLAENDEYQIDKVLLLAEDSGEKTEIGTPYLSKSIPAKVIAQAKGDKVTIIKFTAKKRSSKKQGHRQKYTVLSIGNF